MRIKQVYIANDGTQFDSKQDCIKHEGNHACPICMGEGVIKERYKDVQCSVCSGVGFTRKRLKPVTSVVRCE